MSHFLYISEVFCPWCYGFSPIIEKISHEYDLPFQVICGALMEEPVNLKKRLERTPNIKAFIERMYAITNVRISDSYEKLLTSPSSEDIYFDSQKGGLFFYALKSFLPTESLKIMKQLQSIIYDEGKDIFAKENMKFIIEKFDLNYDEVINFMDNDENKEKSFAETEESFEIMEDIVLYPTLYYVNDDGIRNFISRGYISYSECKNRIEKILNSKNNLESENEDLNQEQGHYCTLDGKCE